MPRSRSSGKPTEALSGLPTVRPRMDCPGREWSLPSRDQSSGGSSSGRQLSQTAHTQVSHVQELSGQGLHHENSSHEKEPVTRNSSEREQDAECIPQATNQFKAGFEATEDRAQFDHQGGDKQRLHGNFTENFPPAGENREEAETLLSIARTEFTCFISWNNLKTDVGTYFC